MKKVTLFIVIFLLQSFPSFGSVNGKGIVCKCLDCKLDHIDPSSYIPNNKPTEIGFHFKFNKVAIYYISKIGDDIKVSENNQTSLRKKKRFSTDENKIKWTYRDSLNIYAYELDRKTLNLSKMNIIKTETHNLRMCEAFSEIDFFQNMNQLSEEYQNSYNKKPKNNIYCIRFNCCKYFRLFSLSKICERASRKSSC